MRGPARTLSAVARHTFSPDSVSPPIPGSHFEDPYSSTNHHLPTKRHTPLHHYTSAGAGGASTFRSSKPSSIARRRNCFSRRARTCSA